MNSGFDNYIVLLNNGSFNMDMNKYKRDFKYRSDEGNKRPLTWLIIVCGIALAAIAFFLDS